MGLFMDVDGVAKIVETFFMRYTFSIDKTTVSPAQVI